MVFQPLLPFAARRRTELPKDPIKWQTIQVVYKSASVVEKKTFLCYPNSDEPKPKRESRTRYGSPKAREKGRSTKLSQRQLSLVHIVAECG